MVTSKELKTIREWAPTLVALCSGIYFAASVKIKNDFLVETIQEIKTEFKEYKQEQKEQKKQTNELYYRLGIIELKLQK